MTFLGILTFMGVAALLVMSPGPNGVLVARTVPGSGRAAGFANIAGFIAAFFLHGAFSIFGISVILVNSAEASFWFKIAGALYLGWLGLKALLEAWRGSPAAQKVAPAKRARGLAKAFGEGFLTNALNPKVSMFYLAAFPQFVPAEGALQAAILLVVLHCLINLAWFGAMILLFGRLSRLAGGPRLRRALKALTGVIFIGFGARLALLRP